jgi:hypothetical protein
MLAGNCHLNKYVFEVVADADGVEEHPGESVSGYDTGPEVISAEKHPPPLPIFLCDNSFSKSANWTVFACALSIFHKIITESRTMRS